MTDDESMEIMMKKITTETARRDIPIGHTVLDAEGDLMLKVAVNEWKVLVPGTSIFYDDEIALPIKSLGNTAVED